MTSPQRAPLWLCIGLPALLLDSLAEGSGEQAPRALIASHGSRRWIHGANREARAAGVRAEQPVATAMALQPRLQLRPYEPEREAELLHQLALWAYQFSPQLSLAPPAALLLEVGASLRLFGGLAPLRAELQRGLERLGYRHRLGVAPTPLAARLQARLGGPELADRAALERALAEVPIAALPLDDKTRQGLQRAGLRRGAQLLQLPRDALARRFGPGCCHTLDRLRGLADDPQPLFQPPEHFEQRLELLQEVDDTAALAFPLRRLVETLAAQLTARDRGVKQFELQLQHPRLAPTVLHVRLLEPSGAAQRLLRVARQQLERQQLPEPVRALWLHARELLPVARDGADLFDRAGATQRPHREVLEQLAARLGQRRVYQLGLRDDHRPECAGRRLGPGGRDTAPAPAPAALPRPLWLLAEPRPAPPGLQIESGPERLESGWWDTPDVRRDYYVARDPGGRRYWLFERRERPGELYLHGYFG